MTSLDKNTEIIGKDVEGYGCVLSYHSGICLDKLMKTIGSSVRIDGAMPDI